MIASLVMISKTLEVPKFFQGLLRMKINGKQNLDKRWEKPFKEMRLGDAFEKLYMWKVK